MLPYSDSRRMEETCLLLFKSTLKPEYRQRILNALAIPPKVFWSTHYNKKYCCDSLKDVIFNRNQSSSLIGKKGIFIFVDAKSEPPRFFPLRQFEIVSSKKVEDNWNLGLIFNNYIIYKEGNLSTFRRKLEEKLESLPPEGPFAQMVDRQVFNEVVQGLSHNVKFDDIIKEITNKSHEECFKKCQINQKVIPAQFFRIELEPKKGRITYDKGDIIFTPGTYRLILYYSAPEGAPFQSTFRVSG